MYCYSQLQKHEICRVGYVKSQTSAAESDICTQTSRYHGFFLESSCAVLFFDILRHPSKYPYNVEYIQMASRCLDIMTNDEPVTNARNSLRKILRVVEETIAKGKNTDPATTSGLPAFADPILQTMHDPTLQSPVSFMGNDNPQSHGNIQFPSLNAPLSSANQLIYFSDLPGSLGNDATGALAVPSMPGDPDAFSPGGEGLDPLSHFHYDVVTTDLYNFFPLNMTPPEVTPGNDTGANPDGAALESR